MQGSAEQKAPAALNLRFTTLYTFPPLYTQKPAARRVFVFVGIFYCGKACLKRKEPLSVGIGTKSGFMNGNLICGE